MEKLTNSFGLLLLFRGLASVVGPPFAGQHHEVHFYRKTIKKTFARAISTTQMKHVTRCIFFCSGWLYDTTKNYTASFFTGGAMLMMCAIMHMMAPCILNCQARLAKRKKGPTVAIPDTQPQMVQGEIIIMEKGYNPEN